MSSIRLPYPHPGQIAVRQQAKRFNWLSAGRRWRKTTLAMAIAVESAARGKTIIWGAPTYDQVRIGFGEAKKAAGEVADFNVSRMEISFPNGGLIHFRSLDDPDNVRGYTADGVVIDECADVKPEAWYQVMRPMLVDTNGWAWGIGTPKGRNWFWEEHAKAVDNSQDTASWQVPTLGVRVTNNGLVREPHPLENPNIPFDEVKQLYRTMPEMTFQQEILAQFIESGGGVFRNVQACATAEPIDRAEPGRQYVAGVDVASLEDFTVVSVIDVEAREMVHLDRFNRCDYPALEDRLHALYERFRMDAMMVEANSIGRPVIDHLVQRGMAVQPFTTTNLTKAAIIQGLQSSFEHNNIRILNDPILINELLAFEAVKTKTGNMSYSAPEGYHDDCVMSLAIANHAISNRVTLVDNPLLGW